MRFIRILFQQFVLPVLAWMITIIPIAYGQKDNIPVIENTFPYMHIPALKVSGSIHSLMDSALNIFRKDPDAALPLFHQALDVSIVAGFPAIASDAFAHIATIYNNKGMYDKAYLETLKTLLLARAYKMDGLLPAVYNSFANRYQRVGQLDSAMIYYYKAIEVVEKDSAFPNKSALPALYTNLSGILAKMGEEEKGLKYLLKAETIAKNTGNKNILALILINKGSAYISLGDLAQSDISLKEALSVARQNHLLQWQHLALSNLGSASYKQGKHKEALAYLEEAVRLKGNIDPNYQNVNISLLGEVYLAMKNYKKAEQYLQQSLQNAERLRIARGRKEGNRMLALLYAQSGRYKKAFEYQYTYMQIKDSIESQEMKQNINQLEIKYQTAQKDKSIIEKELKISKQITLIRRKNLWIGIIVSGTMLLIIIGLLLYRVNRHKQRLQSEKMLNLEQKHIIDQLKAAMNGEEKERTRIARELHDGIGSMIASMKMHLGAFNEAYPELQNADNLNKLSHILSGTASEVRKTAHNLMPDVLTRQGLKGALLQYCESNNNSKLHIDLQYHVPQPMSKSAELFVYRIVQELVQNVVKHAKASHAVVQVMFYEDYLNIMIEDNGIGFDTTLPFIGMGLHSLRSRTEALHGYISIDSGEGKGTILHVKFSHTQLNNL